MTSKKFSLCNQQEVDIDCEWWSDGESWKHLTSFTTSSSDESETISYKLDRDCLKSILSYLQVEVTHKDSKVMDDILKYVSEHRASNKPTITPEDSYYGI